MVSKALAMGIISHYHVQKKKRILKIPPRKFQREPVFLYSLLFFNLPASPFAAPVLGALFPAAQADQHQQEASTVASREEIHLFSAAPQVFPLPSSINSLSPRRTGFFRGTIVPFPRSCRRIHLHYPFHNQNLRCVVATQPSTTSSITREHLFQFQLN